MTYTDRLLWLDMEMTGLRPERERIIEMALVVTDGDLNVVAEGPDIVIHQPDEVLDAMDEWNKSHHGGSGLLDAVRSSTVSEADAAREALAFVRAHCPKRAVPLAGNSVHQDRRFLQTHMPEIDEYLHYRNVDVSTVKELARRWYPAVAAAVPAKKNVHRALDDIRESIEELRYYREHIFANQEGKT